MQQEVSEFLTNALPVFLGDGISQFIELLNAQLAKGVNRLLSIPGAFFPKFIHNGDQAVKMGGDL
jgi:hypothetical protein